MDWYKANFDAAIFQDDGRENIGVIIRDSNGSAMVSLSQNIQLSNSVVEVEAMAANRAIELSSELGFDKIIFEGDSEIVIKALTEYSPSLASFGLLIKDAQVLVDRFNWVRFQHVGRDGNNVTHNLVRHVRHVMGFSVWMEDVPIHCFAIYQADMPLS